MTRLEPERLHDAHGVGGGATDVAFGLHFGRGVDIGDHRHAGIGLAQGAHIGASDRGRKRTAGAAIGDQHHLVGIEQLRGLGHEMHAALHDDLGVGLRRLAGELERVADHVGDAMEDLRRHVIVRQHDGVARALEIVDGLDVRGKARPLDRRDDARYALVEMRRLARDLRRIGEVGQDAGWDCNLRPACADRRAFLKPCHRTRPPVTYNAHNEHIWR